MIRGSLLFVLSFPALLHPSSHRGKQVVHEARHRIVYSIVQYALNIVTTVYLVNSFSVNSCFVPFRRSTRPFLLPRLPFHSLLMSTVPAVAYSEGTALQREAASKFFPASTTIQFRPTSGGVSNFMSYLLLPDSDDKYVLRIYNNGWYIALIAILTRRTAYLSKLL